MDIVATTIELQGFKSKCQRLQETLKLQKDNEVKVAHEHAMALSKVHIQLSAVKKERDALSRQLQWSRDDEIWMEHGRKAANAKVREELQWAQKQFAEVREELQWLQRLDDGERRAFYAAVEERDKLKIELQSVKEECEQLKTRLQAHHAKPRER